MVRPANKHFRLCRYLIILLFSSLTTSAQKTNPMFYKEILLLHKPYTLHSLTREIQRQSGITFSYNALKINPDQKINIKRRTDRLTVIELLALLKRKTGIGYRTVNQSHIIYTAGTFKKRKTSRTKDRRPSDKEKKTQWRLQEEEPEAVAGSTSHDVPQIEQHLMVVGDSALAMSYYLSGGGGGAYGGNMVTKYPVTVDREDAYDDEEAESDLASSTPRRERSGGFYTPLGQSATVRFLKENILLGAGVSADELYYINPTVRAGFDFLYGTIAYNTGTFAHWRYGLGSSVRLNDRWSLRLEVNGGGPLKQPYTITTFDTTTIVVDSGVIRQVITERNTALVVQSRLTRFIMGAEFKMTGNLYVGGSLILNSLHTTYSSNGNPVALSNILPIGYDADDKYRTIKPPYQLSNSYNGNSSSNTKLWIGIQLSLIYKLGFFGR